MADLPDDLGRLENIAANLRARLARIEGRIRRLKGAPALPPAVCRVNRAATDTGLPCDCPVATCNLTRGGLRPAGVLVVGHACKLDGSICESRPDRCSDCPANEPNGEKA